MFALAITVNYIRCFFNETKKANTFGRSGLTVLIDTINKKISTFWKFLRWSDFPYRIFHIIQIKLAFPNIYSVFGYQNFVGWLIVSSKHFAYLNTRCWLWPSFVNFDLSEKNFVKRTDNDGRRLSQMTDNKWYQRSLWAWSLFGWMGLT